MFVCTEMEEKSLILEGLPEDLDRIKPKIELYFRNKRRSGGEILQIREHPDKRRALLVYIRDEGEQILTYNN